MKSDKIKDHRVFTYEGNEDVVRLRLVISETHLIDSIDVSMQQNDDGTFTRELAFRFDTEKSHNGAAYCERYFNRTIPQRPPRLFHKTESRRFVRFPCRGRLFS